MTKITTHLDHSGLVVANLDKAVAQIAALGFQPLPRSFHQVPDGSGNPVPAGTANHCVMLARGYLEVIAVTDPSRDSFSRWEIGGFAERFEGLHLLAIGTSDAEAAKDRLNAHGGTPVLTRDLRRKVDTDSGEQEAAFRLVVVPELSGSDITLFFIEHRTRELLWTPESQIHPNGATALLELVVVSDDPQASRPEYERAFGPATQTSADGLRFELDQSRFLVLTPAAAANHFGAPLPSHTTPHCAGQAVEVTDLAATASLLKANGVPFTTTHGRLTVGPDHACGAFLQFVEARP